MSADPYIGEIMLWPVPYAPTGWLPCDGRLLQTTQYQTLYALIGNTFGGTSPTSFALPDLRNVFVQGVPLSNIGVKGGSGTSAVSGNATGNVTIAGHNLPSHSHAATFAGTSASQPVNLSLTAVQALGGAVPMDGYLLAEGPAAGPGAASIYAPPGTPGQKVSLAGGSSTVSLTPAGTVTIATTGDGAPLAVSLPVQANVAIQPPFVGLGYLIAVQGIWPPRP